MRLRFPEIALVVFVAACATTPEEPEPPYVWSNVDSTKETQIQFDSDDAACEAEAYAAYPRLPHIQPRSEVLGNTGGTVEGMAQRKRNRDLIRQHRGLCMTERGWRLERVETP